MASKFGTPNDDSLFGGPEDDLLRGLGRKDFLKGGGGDDVIYGDDPGSLSERGEGTGLLGMVYDTGSSMNRVDDAQNLIDTTAADASFTATRLDYPNGLGNRAPNNIALSDFLGDDAADLDVFGPDDDLVVDTLTIHFSGYIYIPEGTHDFTIVSDDGFRLQIGGDLIAEYDKNQGFREETGSQYFEGGVYAFDLVWYQNGGQSGLEVTSSLPGNIGDYLYTSLDDVGVALEDPDGDGRYTPADGDPAGDDTIEGDSGNDTLFGNGADDSLYGGSDDDSLSGDAGNDFLDGGSGADWQFGGAGDDRISFDPFDNFMGGGTGNDTLLGTTGDDDIRFDNGNFDQGSKNAGFESVYLGDGSNLLIGGGASDLESSGQGLYVEGGADRDIVSLWEVGDDIVDARGGTDTVYGGPGSDVIFGGDDRDFLYPGADNDTVYGGAGNDVYHVGLGDGSDWLVDAHDGSEDNGLILFHGYNDPEWDDYYGVNPDNFSYVVGDVMVDSGSGPQLERVVTISFDNGEAEGSANYQDGEVRFIAGTIETLNLWDHTDVHGGGPPTAGDFTVYQYQWNETTESFDAVS